MSEMNKCKSQEHTGSGSILLCEQEGLHDPNFLFKRLKAEIQQNNIAAGIVVAMQGS
jgi:hypothetical protein